MLQFLTALRFDGFPLWVVLLICLGVFLASFMDAIAGGGGIISVPTHLIAFGSLPAPYALGTNKVSGMWTGGSSGPPSSSPLRGLLRAPGSSTGRRTRS